MHTHALRRTERPGANSRGARTHTCESAQRASTAARRSGAGRCLSEDGAEGDEHCGRCVVGVDLTTCDQRTADGMPCLRLPTVRRRDKAYRRQAQGPLRYLRGTMLLAAVTTHLPGCRIWPCPRAMHRAAAGRCDIQVQVQVQAQAQAQVSLSSTCTVYSRSYSRSHTHRMTHQAQDRDFDSALRRAGAHFRAVEGGGRWAVVGLAPVSRVHAVPKAQHQDAPLHDDRRWPNVLLASRSTVQRTLD